MAEILSQQEIDALIESFLSKQEHMASKGKGRKSGGVLRIYDFKRPDKFSKEQLRTLQLIHENFSRSVGGFLSAHFGSVVHVTLISVDQQSFDDVLTRIPGPSVLFVVTLEPLGGNALLQLDPALALPIIDRAFGGPGTIAEEGRELTEIERVVLTRVLGEVLGYLKEAWSPLVELKPVLASIETDPLMAQIVAPSEMVVQVDFDVKAASLRGTMSLCVPFLVLEPLLPKLSAQEWYAGYRKVSRETNVDLVRRNIETVEVPVSVWLGRCELRVADFLELEEGDVIELDTPVGRDVEVYIGDRPRFLGRPGRVGRRMGVEITAVAEEGGGR